jgi:oligopeptide/dipeptide ABC transporter ATP-binding protein
MPAPLLEVKDLSVSFRTPYGTARAVTGVSFAVERGQTLGVVGESGCGKSVTALSILQLLPEPAAFIEEGAVFFDGQDLLDLTGEQMRRVRGSQVAMIFQEPMTSLNPVFTVGRQVTEGMAIHGVARGRAAWKRAAELLARVGIEDPEVLHRYPHELSGGMRQRVMIAGALACRPKLLIADEPTTALDVTVQAQILELLAELQRELGMALLLISHDLGIVAEMCDRVAVMYAGEIVEAAAAEELYAAPKHPYTRALFASLPTRGQRGRDLVTLEGRVPDASAWPPGCRFEPRCPERFAPCARLRPGLAPVAEGASGRAGSPAPPPSHQARCLLYPASFPAGAPAEAAP